MDPKSRHNLEANVKFVHDITHKPLSEIRQDLRITKSVEFTIGRAFTGRFLKELSPARDDDDNYWVMTPTIEDAIPSPPLLQGKDSTSGEILPQDKDSTSREIVPQDEGKGKGKEIVPQEKGSEKKRKRGPIPVLELSSDEDSDLPPMPVQPTKWRKPTEDRIEKPKHLNCLSPSSPPEISKTNRPIAEILDIDFDSEFGIDTFASSKEKQTVGDLMGLNFNDDIAILDLSQEGPVTNGGDSMIADLSRFMRDITTPPTENEIINFVEEDPWGLEILESDTEPHVTERTISVTPEDSDEVLDIFGELVSNAAHINQKGKDRETEMGTKSSVPVFSASTTALLASLKPIRDDSDSSSDEEDGEGVSSKPKKKAKATATRKTSNATFTKTSAKSKSQEPGNALAASKRSKVSEEEKSRRAAEKAKKEAGKEERKKVKDAAAARKVKEQELASINKLKTSKKDSAPEMIVDVSHALAHTEIGAQLGSFLTNWGCEVNAQWRPALGVEAEWKVVKWRRKVRSEYDPIERMFLPLPSGKVEIRDEKHILVHLTAKEFIEIAYPEGDSGMTLSDHVNRMKRLVPSAITSEIEPVVIYMIEGLPAFIRKQNTNFNRDFRNRVKNAMGTGGTSSSCQTADASRAIDEDMVEDALLELQIMHKCLIHQTATPIQSAEWISIMTGDISTIPYKNAQMATNTAFCTDVGQVKTGADPQDTFAKMLQEIHRVTPAAANVIVEKYSNVVDLIRAFESEGKEVLSELPLLATRNGAPSNRSVGKALSTRIANVFLGTDPDSLDV